MNKEWNYFVGQELVDEISQVQSKIKTDYFPTSNDLLTIFKLSKPEDVKVVIIGQDPYHNVGQANGIAFSVNNGIKTPPSLKNIFKELKDDLGIDHFDNNDLSNWVRQGVFLINTIWTVEPHKPNSHKELGWEKITISILEKLNKSNPNIVYCLWGNSSQKVFDKLEFKTNNVIKSHHPSPLSYRGFKGSKPFSKINSLLAEIGENPIDFEK
ncbi:uracil-DNA glycosylase [Spiroplasma endosymbiont of Othius punctulatus]|uniref:uracil-DNA glycosylase n=1 Tax=Spiroplasma endosymbiont of Othius punctulatus TaxID=3066289 RepID=UPI0030CE4063